ncbi:unnamed protein product [Parascedosporium putredinis]|uniref:ClpP/crotonase n=1 Tax=Parascedosporium putredinis TaxID=1442378 RepID=A0A9P1MDR2_9PEZI|nr:unnamed protein product [Parascedosporium putredinis]CAI8003117.1 unnamed protein product [Parascedosporium putredinis]
MSSSVISVEYKGRVAVITIDNGKKLGALNQDQYYELATKMNEVATHDEVYITVLIGKGRFFSAGADVTTALAGPDPASTAPSTPPQGPRRRPQRPRHRPLRRHRLHRRLHLRHPDTFLLTPFASLGLVAEGAASRALTKRLGPAKANEALLMSKKIPANALLQCGYLNEIFDVGSGSGADVRFKERVLKEVDDRLGEHLVGDSLIGIKKCCAGPRSRRNPQEEFRKIARGEKRHKL